MSSPPVPSTLAPARFVDERVPVPWIDLTACTSCGLCVAVCPSGAVGISVDVDGAWVPAIEGARCTRCFDCESACPERAIEVPFAIVEEAPTLHNQRRRRRGSRRAWRRLTGRMGPDSVGLRSE